MQLAQQIELSESYIKIRSIPIGKKAIAGKLTVGMVDISIDGHEGLYSGNLNENGVITGLTKLFYAHGINEETKMEFEIIDQNLLRLKILKSEELQTNEKDQNIQKYKPLISEYIADKKSLKWIHFEIFRPTNLKYWIPKTEPDIYMVFGVLQEYTDYSYCCGTSKEILSKIGYLKENNSDNPNKPDAILIEKLTDRYVLAEFKMKSSDYKKNHNPEDVDVLVVWEDDETEKDKLPNKIVNLYETSKAAFEDVI